MFEAIIQALQESAIKRVEKNGGIVVPLPPGWTTKEIAPDFYEHTPSRIRVNPSFRSANSFCDYVNRFKDEGTVIFADPDTAKFTAVLDYHISPTAPRWGSHTATCFMPLSPEFLKWRDNSGKAMNQMEFARFLEMRLGEIMEPTHADLMQSVMDFQATKQIVFRSGARLRNGMISLSYVEEGGQTGGTVELPNVLKVGVQVFTGYSSYADMPALIRWRINEQKLSLYYEIDNIEKYIHDTVEEVFNAIAEKTGIEPYVGSV